MYDPIIHTIKPIFNEPIEETIAFDCKKIPKHSWHPRAISYIQNRCVISYDGKNEILTITGAPAIIEKAREDFKKINEHYASRTS